MQVQLLGEPRGFANGQWHSFLPDRRYQLLVYLACTGGWVSREKLADVFWSNLTQQAARANLRKVIFKLKSLEWLAGFEHHEGAVRWQVRTDIAEFLQAVESKNYARALERFQGPFLQGFNADTSTAFDLWIETERARLEAHYQDAVHHYTTELEQKAAFETAIAVVQKALEFDPLHEVNHQHVMRLEWKRGDPEAALAQFERCRETLQRELGIEPRQETLDLLQTIEAGGRTGTNHALLLRSSETVPDAPTSLFGRDTVLKQAFSYLERKQHVLLHGFGGMGKTVLAATLSRRWLDSFGTSVLWLQVGSDDPDTVFAALAEPFDGQQELAKASHKTKVLHDILKQQTRAHRHVAGTNPRTSPLGLLVLDDVWNAYSLSKVLEAVPANLAVLITSRQRYPKLITLYVDRLERCAALDLLNHYACYAPDERESFDADPDSNRLCELLGDHPFAIRLSGLALREESLTLKQLLARIGEAPHDFKIPGELKHTARESVASLLNASLEPLNDQAYEAFLTFGVLPTPSVTPELLARCARRNPDEIENALFTLVQRGLAERLSRPGSDLVSYRVHDLAHSYARANRLQRTKTFIQATLAFVQQHKDDVTLLDTEISNILAAAQAAQERGLEDDLIRFMHLLNVEGFYYSARGHTLGSVGLLSAAADLAEKLNRLEEAHALLGKLGDYFQNFVLDFERAVDTYQRARTLASKCLNQGREAVYLSAIGQVKTRQDRADAEVYLEQAYQLAKDCADDLSLCLILEKLGYVEGLKGNYTKSAQFLHESLDVVTRLKGQDHLKEAEVRKRQFFALLNLGQAEGSLGNHDQSLLYRQDALRIAEEDGNELWVAYAHCEIGEMLHLNQDPERARQHMVQALALFVRNNARKDADNVLSFLKNAGYDIGNLS